MSQQSTAAAGFVVIDAKVGETFRLVSVDFGEICLTIHAKDGQRVRLGVKADKTVKVHRPERKAT